ncbi:MAG: phospholipase D-like domain-containing protein [Candidatus Hodarchaeales archaeon]|jgi:phosphatidylserine/phosphatidylglycerophosphate/cardiolipin synthase-like enzyme
MKIRFQHTLIILTVLMLTIPILNGVTLSRSSQTYFEPNNRIELYTPKFDFLNLKESMTLTPIVTPDNALDVISAWIDLANVSIALQNQYITQFDDNVAWALDPSPIVQSLVAAHDRGVDLRIQVNEDSDSDDITAYFLGLGIEIKWMGNLASNPDKEWISDTHNKLVIIDGKVTILSSINFSENAFLNNRETGLVIQNTAVAAYYESIFDSDWNDGEVPSSAKQGQATSIENIEKSEYSSPTNLVPTNFTGTYNVTLFTNPDNADEIIFQYLQSAQSSIYVSMYTISRPDFNNTLIDLKNGNPAIDIQVLISKRRVGSSENEYTYAAAKSLTDNAIPVYNSTSDLNFYHNKYWIIDGTHIFIYSGNWSPRSVSPQLESGDDEYASGEANRDMGIAIHEAEDIAAYFKSLWDADVAVADSWNTNTDWTPTTEITPLPFPAFFLGIISLLTIRRRNSSGKSNSN